MPSRFILVASLLAAIGSGCSTPNLYLASKVNPEYKFKKREHIIIALRENPSHIERNFLPVVIDVMREQGFHIVDSAASADRLLACYVDSGTTFPARTASGFIYEWEDSRGRERAVTSAKTVFVEEKANYTAVEFIMYDIDPVWKSEDRRIWVAIVRARDKDF